MYNLKFVYSRILNLLQLWTSWKNVWILSDNQKIFRDLSEENQAFLRVFCQHIKITLLLLKDTQNDADSAPSKILFRANDFIKYAVESGFIH